MTEEPYEIVGAARPGRWLVSCDHATNHVPEWVNGGDLGLPAEDMQRHQREKHPVLEEVLECELCDYKCLVEEDMVEHRKKHQESKTFKCDECDYSCQYRSQLTQHKVIHGEAMFNCDECQYETKRKSDLYRHKLAKHTEHKYECDHCDFKASVKGNLTRHIATQHNDDDEDDDGDDVTHENIFGRAGSRKRKTQEAAETIFLRYLVEKNQNDKYLQLFKNARIN